MTTPPPTQNIHKILITPPPPPKKKKKINKKKYYFFQKTQRNIEIQNFEPPKMARAYVCMQISEYPAPTGTRAGQNAAPETEQSF